ncbi:MULTISPECIES: TetR/AcrR family transcriptional regulator [Rhodococcus]|uniref:TetR family transcriptional regulator n=1 Tax=Rhodococcus pyridinivorans AK37 TaxID=1114960 RepID=H0JUD0_9NOCA|nr:MULTISPECIES: TetR family transcriptional regulator [Rhodococcus]EHK82228.1 TetR family transcriptional regulator [Rhodococcus pyridinivorans AK37]MCT7294000.1 TetR family transcriptional regulator [Rhodococcus sp. PAE-6]
MARDGDSTRDRILGAATAEFAEHGIAGARIERIAKAARTSKERVYAYFRGKEQLYRFVAARELEAMATAVPLDPADLPGYAVRVYDHVVAHPERLRLMQWGQLEMTAGVGDDPFGLIVEGKIEQLRRAQEAGALDKNWDPADVIVFVSQLATSWAGQVDLVPAGPERHAFLTSRRQAIEKAVRRLFPGATS